MILLSGYEQQYLERRIDSGIWEHVAENTSLHSPLRIERIEPDELSDKYSRQWAAMNLYNRHVNAGVSSIVVTNSDLYEAVSPYIDSSWPKPVLLEDYFSPWAPLDRNVELIAELFPDLKHLVIVGNNSSEINSYLESKAKATFAGDLKVERLEDLSISLISQQLPNLPKDSLVIDTGFDGDELDPHAITKNIAKSVNAPFWVITDHLDDPSVTGVLGGYVEVPERTGKLLAELALSEVPLSAMAEIAAGTGDPRYLYKFDSTQLDRWGISESQLPAGTLIINVPELFTQDEIKVLFSGGVSTLAALLLVLFWRERSRRKLDRLYAQDVAQFTQQLNAAARAADLFIYDEDIAEGDGVVVFNGLSHEEKLLVGAELFKSVPAEYHPELEAALAGDTSARLPIYFDDSQKPKWVQIEVLSTHSKDGRDHRIVMSKNITHEVELRAEIRSQLEELESLTDKRNKLFGMVAHELRTPVAAISMMATDEDAKSWNSSRADILRSSRDLLHTIDDMRLLINPELKRPVRPEAFFVNELNSSVASSVASIVASTGVQYSQYNAIPLTMSDESFTADTYRVRVVVTNLVKNACLHSEGSNVWMMSRLYMPREGGTYLEWLVGDNGKGIASNQVDRLFEAGERGDSKADGTGFGLYIAKSWIEEVRGSIEYRPRSTGGSEFLVRIPLDNHAQEKENEAVAKAAVPVDPTQVIQQLHVLMAEDEMMLRMLGQKLLSTQVASVTATENGRLALKAKTPEHNLVLTDYFMPEMSGVELTRRLRAEGYTGAIIGVTAATIGEQRQELLDAGADMVLLKPLTSSMFKSAVSELIQAGRLADIPSGGEGETKS